MNKEERQAIIHLLDKQARYEYCIKNNISFSDEDYEAYIIRQSMINKDKEIERLNNIINELEKFLKDKIDSWKKANDDEIVKDTIYHERLAVRIIYDHLQELKGDGSNEKDTN